jgi:hypothetical protein
MSDSPETPVAPVPKPTPWWRKRRVVIPALLVLLAAALRAALPWAIARVVEWQVPKQVGLPVRIANVDLWLLRAAVAVEGLVVGRKQDAPSQSGPDPGTALLRFDRLFVDLDWSDLFDRRIRLTALALDGPRVRVEREADGRIDPLGTSGEPPAPEPEPAEPAEPSEPWAFAVDRFDLKGAELELFDVASQRTPVEFALAGLGLSDVSVAGSDLGLGGIEIQAPDLRVDREFVFGQAAAPPAAPAGPPPAAEPGAPLAYEIQRIGIQDAAFTLRTDAGPLDVRIRLAAERVNARPGELFPVDLELRLGEGSFALQGQLGLNPPAYDGRLAYADLPLPPLTVAARPDVAAWVKSCHAFGDLTVKARLAGPESGVRVAGTANIRDFAVGDPKADEVSLAWQDLEIVAREVVVPLPEEGQPARPTRVALERIRLEGPDGRYTLPATSLAELLGGGAQPAETPEQGQPEAAAAEDAATQPAAAPGEAAAPVELTLDSLEIVGARARFRDQTVTPPYDTRVRDLSVAASDVRFPELRAQQVRVRGIIPDATRFDLRGGLDRRTGEFRFELERLALPPFNSYASGAGYSVAGEASLASTLRMRGESYQADSQLVLHQLRVDAQKAGDFEGRFGVPIDLALALLRDPQGDIRLPIPVRVDESGAGLDVGAVVGGALRQALTGALASPLKMVGAVLPGGGGKPSLDPLACVPGGDALAPDAQARLAPLADLLTQRPALGFRLAGRTGPGDRPVVAEQILVERALAGEDLPEVEDAGFLARRRVTGALAARGRGEGEELSAEDQALLARYVAAVAIPPERLAALARRRAELVRDALASAHGIEPGRLEISEPAEADAPAVLLEFIAAQS